MKQHTDTKSNFSKRGWWVIIYCLIALFLYTGTTVDGMNITIQAFVDEYGWDYATLLGFGTVAGFAAIIGQFFFGWVCSKKGPKFTMVSCMFLAGASYILYANSWSPTVYVIALTLVTVFSSCYAYIGGGALVANWFPKKKGLAMGYTTMGNNFASAFFVPMISWLIGALGLIWGMSVVGIMVFVLGLLGILTIKDTPEEYGETPDNVPKEELKNYFEVAEGETYISQFTTAKLLRTKETWLVALVLGINFLVTVGIMSQLVQRNVSLGFEQNTAIALMTVCALIGVAGSYAWGWIDQKFGTKRSMVAFGIWYAIAIACNVSEIMPLVYLSVFLIGVSIGGAANFTASLTTSVFGRHDFKLAYALIYPLLNFVQQSNFMVNAFALSATGSLRGAYIFYIVLLLINAFIVSRIDDRKYNKDYAAEEHPAEQAQ